MNKIWFTLLALCLALTACAAPDEPDHGAVKSDLSAVTPELAGAYLAVMDELSAALGYTEAEASEGECLHGGFVRDWDADGVPELCLLLKTSPRDDGTPRYGWYPPTLYLYTVRGGEAVRAGECDLYFATGGREAIVAVLTTEGGMQYVRWDRSALADETYVGCYALENGAVRQVEAPANTAETAREFVDALGAQPLLYNNSGEAGIEGAANARELRDALAARAA
ncbi:MAG: hypothetical protein IJU66_07365 [Oscillospiraceae bacterium]|nr:hypothetical protein [Oscillospiraceae bacterium]